MTRTWQHGQESCGQDYHGWTTLATNVCGGMCEYLPIKRQICQISDIVRNSPKSEIISDWLPFCSISEWSDIGLTLLSEGADNGLSAQFRYINIFKYKTVLHCVRWSVGPLKKIGERKQKKVQEPIHTWTTAIQLGFIWTSILYRHARIRCQRALFSSNMRIGYFSKAPQRCGRSDLAGVGEVRHDATVCGS